MSTLTSIFYVLGRYLFRPKMEKTRPMKGELDGKVFSSCQSRHFFTVNSMIQGVFPIFTLSWRVYNYDCRQGKGIIKRNENTNDITRIYELSTVQAKFLSLRF